MIPAWRDREATCDGIEDAVDVTIFRRVGKLRLPPPRRPTHTIQNTFLLLNLTRSGISAGNWKLSIRCEEIKLEGLDRESGVSQYIMPDDRVVSP